MKDAIVYFGVLLIAGNVARMVLAASESGIPVA